MPEWEESQPWPFLLPSTARNKPWVVARMGSIQPMVQAVFLQGLTLTLSPMAQSPC